MAHWYFCSTKAINFGEKPCFCVDGHDVDKVVEKIILSRLRTPPLAVLKTALEEDTKAEEAKNLFIMRERERLDYKERHLEEQIENCDPKNHLVYDRFTSQLNQVLQDRENFEQRVKDEESRRNKNRLTEEMLERLCKNASLVPTVWHDSRVSPQEKKQILHCLIKAVQLKPEGAMFTGTIYWKAGAESTFRIYRRDACNNIIRELHAEGCTTGEIVERLARGETSTGQAFKRHPASLHYIYKRLGLKPNRKPSWIWKLKKEATERRGKGESCNRIAADFNRRNLKTTKGKLWREKSVFNLTSSGPGNTPPLKEIYRELLTDAKARGLTHTQTAREFNEKRIARDNKRPWNRDAIQMLWVAFNQTARSNSQN